MLPCSPLHSLPYSTLSYDSLLPYSPPPSRPLHSLPYSPDLQVPASPATAPESPEDWARRAMDTAPWTQFDVRAMHAHMRAMRCHALPFRAVPCCGIPLLCRDVRRALCAVHRAVPFVAGMV